LEAPRSLREVAADLTARAVPLVFVDTCAVIDVVRFANTDRDIKLDVIEDTQRLVNAARRGSVALVGSELLALEVNDHLQGEVLAATAALSKRSAEVTRVMEGLDLRIGPGSRAAWDALRTKLLGLPDNLRDLADALLGEVAQVGDDRECLELARVRAVLRFAPSHKKESRKDCEIFEHALALSKRLSGAGHAKRRVFATVNLSDFDPTLLRAELSDAGLDIVPSLSHAYQRVGCP